MPPRSLSLKAMLWWGEESQRGGRRRRKGVDVHLGDDGTELAGTSRDTVGGGTVAGREHLTGDDEGGGVGSEVLRVRRSVSL